MGNIDNIFSWLVKWTNEQDGKRRRKTWEISVKMRIKVFFTCDLEIWSWKMRDSHYQTELVEVEAKYCYLDNFLSQVTSSCHEVNASHL